MKILKLLCFFLIVLGFAYSPTAHAFLTGPIDLKSATEKSDLVVRGRVLKVEGPIEGKMRGFIQVDRVLKGELQGSEAEVFLLPWNLINTFGPVPQSVTPGDYDLFFLKKDGKETVAVDPYHFKFPVRQGNPIVGQANFDALEAVRSELLWSLTPEKVFSVEAQRALAKAEGENKETRTLMRRYVMPLNVQAIEQLRFFPRDEQTINRMEDLLSSPKLDVIFRGRLIEALLRLNQPQALAPAVKYIQDNADSKELAVQKATQSIRSSISLIHDRAGFSDLVPLISHPNAEVRASAIIAMARLIQELKFPSLAQVNVVPATTPPSDQSGTKKKQLTARQAAYQVVPLLIPLLDDPDTMVRFQTILALTEITSQPGKGPGYVPWDKNYKRSDEAPYIAYWKSWWATQRLKAQNQVKDTNAEQLPGAAGADAPANIKEPELNK